MVYKLNGILHFKKISRNKKVILWTGIIVILSIFLINLCYMRYVSKDVNTYLKYNTQEFNLDNKPNKIDIGNTKGYRVFLAGESHAETKSYAAKKALMEYFNKNLNIRYFLVEIGLGSGIVLDNYIQTGDEDELDYYMSQLGGTSAYTNEEAEFWKSLYEYNQNLENDKKIHVIGLDVDHQVRTAVKSLSLMIDDSNVDEDLSELNRFIENNEPEALYKLEEGLDKYPDKIEKLFGEYFDDVKQLCINFDYTCKFLSAGEEKQNSRDYDIRDEAMMSNFLYAYNKYKNESFFGEFGSEHIYQSACETGKSSPEYNRFGMRLNESSSPVKGKVCSILYLYPIGNNADLGRVELKSECIDYSVFQDYLIKDIIISLDERNSPFFGRDYLFNNDGNNTCDYIQKIIVLPNSKKCSEYDENFD